jgi:hypothetical protein
MAAIRVNLEDKARIERKIRGMFSGMADDFQEVGKVGAEGIVRTTLAGIAEGDAAFPAYSKAYQELLAAVGGKSRQVVDLRGVFYPSGAGPRGLNTPNLALRSKRSRSYLKRGATRQAYITVTLPGGRTFLAKTKLTRPALGLTDKLSEMSLDLIQVETTDTTLRIIYEPRRKAYMVWHQEGRGNLPVRKWFSVQKAGVWFAMVDALERLIAARVAWFNDQSQLGNSPP